MEIDASGSEARDIVNIEQLAKKNGLLRKNHLLVIGINEYTYCPKLKNAVKDAKDFTQLLVTHYHFEGDRVTTLLDQEANRKDIYETLKKYIPILTDQDNLVIYFSGHGHYDEIVGEGYLIPVDVQVNATQDYISYDYLLKVIKAIKAHHILLIVDSCYSGAAIVEQRIVANERLDRDPSRWIIASGRNEVVLDGMPGNNSPFAEQLLAILRDHRNDGIRASDLAQKVITSTLHNAKQAPVGRPLYGVGDRGGEFFFMPIDYQPSNAKMQSLLSSSPNSDKSSYTKVNVNKLEQKENQMDHNSTQNQIIQYLADGKIKKALQLSLKYTKNLRDSEHYDSMILLSGRFNFNESQFNNGLSNQETHRMERARIANALKAYMKYWDS